MVFSVANSVLQNQYSFAQIYTLNQQLDSSLHSLGLYPSSLHCAYPEVSSFSHYSYTLDQFRRKILFDNRCIQAVKKFNPDIIHMHAPDRCGRSMLRVAKRLKIPVVLTIHQMGVFDQAFIDEFVEFTEHTEKYMITCVSNAVKNSCGFSEKLPEDKIRVIANGIDLSKFNESGMEDTAWRRANGIPIDAFVFASAGRIVQLKRFDLFIDAAIKILEEGIDAHFVIAGQGDPMLTQQLIQNVETHGIGRYFHFLPWQIDIKPMLANTNVYVQCSENEGFSLTLMEACSMGCASIATHVGAVPEIFKESIIMVDSGSTSQMAAAMKQMMRKEIRIKYSHLATELAAQYSSQKMVEGYKQVYENLLS